jgi:hypothetical protein
MSLQENEPILELGDIIQISAPNNSELNEKIFFIDYIDNRKLNLIDTSTLDNINLDIENGKFTEESIENITLISKADEKGYAKQNNLLPNTWIDLHISDDIPVIITGQITNLEEDMIEILTTPGNDTIYIDFAYKGIPNNIPIEKIVIREEPISKKDEEEEELPEDVKEKPEKEEEKEEIIEEIEENVNVPNEENEKENISSILEANKITFGEELGEIRQIVDVDETQKRFSIETQLDDLLDDLLATIPSYKRNRKTLRNLHILVQRYKELRERFSSIDDYGNTNVVQKRGELFKPLLTSLQQLNKNLFWIIPVVKNKRKIYVNSSEFMEENSVSEYNDYVLNNFYDDYKKETEIIDTFNENTIIGENKYDSMFRELNKFYTPYSLPSNLDDVLLLKNVENNLHVVVDNLENFDSSVIQGLIKQTYRYEKINLQRFVIEKYNLGLTRLASKMKSSRLLVDVVPLTPSDELPLTSFLTLPEPFIYYSKIQLPKTSIYEKSNLNLKSFNYWNLLRKRTNVNKVVININEKFDNINLLKNINHYVLENRETNLTKEEVYEKFLENIIPSTGKLFELIKPLIANKVSYDKIIEYLEPFMIYSDDIVKEQHELIVSTLLENINTFKTKIEDSKKELDYIKNKSSPSLFNGTYLYDLIKDESTLINFYNVNEKQTSSEIIKNILLTDQGRLFDAFISKDLTDLYSFNDIQKTVNDEMIKIKEKMDSEKKTDTCKNYVLTKKYVEMDELENDNNKDIYFDKKYDSTYYDILKEYPQNDLTKDEYILLVSTKLQETIGLNEENATYDAISMIEGQRKVKDGQFAVLETYNNDKPEFKYFKRINQQWVYDEAVTKDSFGDTNKFFCNTQEKCLEVNEECLQTDSSLENEKVIRKILENFENDFLISQDELKRNTTSRFKYYTDTILKIQNIDNYRKNKYDYIKAAIGNMLEQKDIVVSPHSKLLSLIINQPDFVERQENIIKFANQFTREATEGEQEYFRYCIDTGVPLLPTFLLELAEGFHNGTYTNTIERICKDQGQISDDGDAWVDKYSGFVIKPIEGTTDEGFNAEGFKVKTNFEVKEDIVMFAKKEKTRKDEDKLILNVIRSVSNHIGVKINQEEFIVNHVNKFLLKKLGTKSEYKKKNEGKKVVPYKSLYNNYLLYTTVAYLTILIQTSIPSLKTSKTFPGCIRSLNGYPLGSINDMSFIKYVSCIVEKMKSEDVPWNAIKKSKIDKIEKNITSTIKNIIDTNVEIKEKLKEKREYLEKHVEEENIPEELSINNWKTFLPPLSKLNIDRAQGVTPDFKKMLDEDIVKLNKKQDDKIFLMVSKLIYYSLYIQTKIENIVKHETLLLKTNNDEPFLQNACCSDGSINTVQYFNNKESSILEVNKRGKDLMNLFYKYKHLSKAFYLLSNFNTKLVYPELGNNYSEDTIYRAFIHYCKFNQDITQDEHLLRVCNARSSNFLKTDSFEEKMKTLKSEGKNYGQEDLLFLMKLVQRKNTVNVDLYKTIQNKQQQLNNVLEYLSSKSLEPRFDEFILLMTDLNNSSVEQYKEKEENLRNMLLSHNNTLKTDLMEFLNEYKQNENTNKSFNFLKDVKKWISLNNENVISGKGLESFKISEFLTQVIKDINIIYPTVILNKKKPFKKIPKHLNLSKFHESDIKDIIEKEIPLETFFNKENIFSRLMLIVNINKYVTMLLDYLPLFNPIVTKDIYEYLLLFSLQNYYKDQEIIEEDLEEQQDINEYEREGFNKTIAKLLIKYLDIFAYRKNKVLLYNRELIQEKVFKEKEEERILFTRRFEVLSDEDRRVEKMYEDLKLGKYAKGLGKSVLEYSAETYDEERQEFIQNQQPVDIDTQEAYDMSFIPDDGEIDALEF